jgi:predicted kinase
MYSGNSQPGPVLILLSGLPGSGKTTFAKKLARRLHVDIVESDAIRRSLTRQPTYSNIESGRVFAIAEEKVQRIIEQGRVALLDATNLARRDYRRFIRAADGAGARAVMVRVTAPEHEIHRRLSRPRRGHSQADVVVYERMRERVQPFTIPVVTVDSRFDPEPSIDLIISLVLRND